MKMIECCVNVCPSNSLDEKVAFYRFPVIRSDGNRQPSIERRSAWIRAVGRKNIDWDLAVVCSRHFVSGRPSQLFEQDSTDWVPTLELNSNGPIQKNPAVESPRPPEVKNVPDQISLLELLLEPSDPPPKRKDSFEETIRTNSTEICRLCLGKEAKLTKPFQDDSGPNDSLLQKIYECTTLKITLKASYPTSICAICDSKLSEYSSFREKCIQNDELLRTILDRGKDDQDDDVILITDDVPPIETVPSILPLEFPESNEIRDLQLQLYGPSDENTSSHNEFVNSERANAATLPKITSVTSNAAPENIASPRDSPSAVATKTQSSKTDVASQSPKPIISVKPLASLAATTPENSTQQTVPDEVGSSGSKETEKPSNYGKTVRLECSVCTRPFRNAYTLRRHMKLHTEENLFICEYCGKKFNDRANWKIHLRAHTGDNLLRCLVCFKTFISPSTLKYHLRSHRKMNTFECKFCDESSKTYDELAEHMTAKHGDMKLDDVIASEEPFIAGDFLKIEMEADETALTVTIPRSNEVTSERTLQLPPLTTALRCGPMPTSQDKEHSTGGVKIKEEVLDPDIEIKQEPMDVDTVGSLDMEAGMAPGFQRQLTALIPQTDEDSPPVILFRCDYCMKIFKYLYELRVHMKIHNTNKLVDSVRKIPSPSPKKRRHPSIDADVEELAGAPQPEHQCDKCEKCFRTEELLRVHVETHKLDNDVTMARSCKICNKTFKCELNLKSHMQKHHPSESSVSERVEHAEKPVDEKPLSPDNSSSNDAGNQSQSESVDTSSTTEGGSTSIMFRKCEICAMGFNCSFKLEEHMMTHFKKNEAVAIVPSEHRPYKCTECHKRFKRKDYLLIHIRTHTGERRHKCDMCSSAFVHPSNLITHRKLHSNDRPFKCDLCPAAFKLFAGLKIHRKRCVLKYLQENALNVTEKDGTFSLDV